ncbi:MAG: radical SAM protein [Desulfobacterales bacterium]|nr:radical SAM protein [Desulfobacterales bacterium]
MKTLLIYPYSIEDRIQEDDISVIPIGVYYVGALLKQNGYDIEILNWYNIDRKAQQIEKILSRKNADIIGFSILHTNRWGGIDIARIAKRINPDVKIIFGGVGATMLWKHFLTHFNEIDFVVMGEGEHTFLNLVKRLKEQDHKEIENIKGLAFRKGKEIIHTGDADTIQGLDELPIPANYFQYQHVSSSRGCPGNCTFCGSPEFWGHKVRFHSPEYFVRQLEVLNKRGVSFFYFSDDIFAIKKDRVIEICKKILEKNLKITWAAISRVDYVNEDILYWMRKAGCIQISYGVESGSEKIRKKLNKNIQSNQIKKAFALTAKYGILPRAYFIYACPGESWATIQETIDLIREIKPLATIFYILDIFPGTSLCSDYMKTFTATDDIWLERIEDIMYHETDPHLTQELILAFGERLRSEFYKSLPEFVDSLELVDKEDLYEMHSDFCSRLGMTFSHGDYAGIEGIKEKDKIAEKMYEKSLEYYPNLRAYLGLGIIKQKRGAHEEAIKILSEGIGFFPDSEQMNACMDVSMEARFMEC